MRDDLVRLDELLHESLLKEYDYLGKQDIVSNSSKKIDLYNCRECGSTIEKHNIVSHYIKQHYYLGLSKLRRGDNNDLSKL